MYYKLSVSLYTVAFKNIIYNNISLVFLKLILKKNKYMGEVMKSYYANRINTGFRNTY